MAGEVGILNVGAGDTKISFDPANPAEVKRASKIVGDMLRRGFALLVEVGRDDKGPLYRRATGFDPETAEYIIAGAPDEFDAAVNPRPKPNEEEETDEPAGKARSAAGGTKGRGRSSIRVAASSTNAVAIARTAGG